MLLALYLIAITAEAMTAALAAGRRDMDWVGVSIIACVTALGGGTLRDVVLGHYPVTWVLHPEYLWITAAAALLTALVAPVMRRLRRVFLWLDALGLVVFTVIGCQIALRMELPTTVVLISGMITGCAGGILRDILCNDIPLLLRKELYASVSVLTGSLFIGAQYLGMNLNVSMVASMIVGLVVRMLALRYNWQMPKFVYRDEWR
ncbi:trimeric intracellular cation channel family protein [Pusillimonas sp. SM2304]|uniref:trimeric intracellular cation channel family protein n=1 Tax=Pusillimonas sp. SM2304 TaxID=3073241 RepID=UPI002877173C|nr:trimeric intracellular cation channel family protein [Pusillimonas sp. SM2304]MDS1140306.1 trimeric intracellular cation channel family protein [Pusillimonas sp. SM2304]